MREYIRATRDPDVPPGETVANFEEYTRLYRESWSEPHIRWLLSTVPSAMVFDDHDVHDDWNTSNTWVETMRATGWWDERIVGGFATYWLYQHMGNLSPQHLAEDDLYRALRDGRRRRAEILREFAFRADREVAGTRWSYCRDFGRTRLIMIDSRAGRVLDPPEERSMLDPDEWHWLEEHAAGEFDHLLIGTSLPFLLAPGLHYLESWNEAVCNGAWGKPAALLGEKVRQGARPRALGGVRLLARSRRGARARASAPGEHGTPPATDRRALGRRPPRVPRRGRLPARHRDALRRLPGDVLAVPQPARRARAALDPLRVQPRGHAASASCWRAPPASATRRCAGASRTRTRSSTTRSASSSSQGRRSRLWLQKTVPGENDGYSLETVFEQTLA